MNRIKNNQTQDKIISKLFFDHKQNQAWCIKIDMDSIISDCLNLIKNKKRRISRVKLVRIFHYYLLKLIRSKIEDFLIQYSCSLYDIYFECDSDCRNFIKQNGLRHTDIGKAHTIADIVAWANNRNKEPIGALSLDLTDDIRKTIYKYIKKSIPHQLVDRHLVFPDGPQGSDTTYKY